MLYLLAFLCNCKQQYNCAIRDSETFVCCRFSISIRRGANGYGNWTTALYVIQIHKCAAGLVFRLSAALIVIISKGQRPLRVIQRHFCAAGLVF